MTIIQNAAPGPPMPIAIATPAILPETDGAGERRGQRLELADLARRIRVRIAPLENADCHAGNSERSQSPGKR
jgi:hypothetical protein